MKLLKNLLETWMFVIVPVIFALAFKDVSEIEVNGQSSISLLITYGFLWGLLVKGAFAMGQETLGHFITAFKSK